MRAPLVTWLQEQLAYEVSSILQDYDTAARRDHALSQFSGQSSTWLFDFLVEQNELFDFVDYLVFLTAQHDHRFDSDDLIRLEHILEQNGSAWRVGKREGNAGLERRVPAGVELAAEQAMQRPGHAGDLLSEAWHAAFGRNPDPEKAYSKAVKAVEAAAIPVVSPRHAGATLGTVLGQLRADGDWEFPADREDQRATISSVLLGMTQVLWTGQNDRHAGQPDYAATSQPTAEAAVLLAVPLVQWFASGNVARRTSTGG